MKLQENDTKDFLTDLFNVIYLLRFHMLILNSFFCYIVVIGDKLAKELTGCDAEEDDLDIDSSSSSSSFLIGQVDCKKQSKLCRQHDIVNFPTIKYGFLESPTASAAAASNDGTSSPNLIEYQGSHDYDDLKEFVELLLQQPCTTTDSESNTTGTNCSNEQREFLDKLQHESSLNDIELMIEQEETLLKQIYLDFELSVDTKFQQQYTTLTQTRDDELISIRQDMDILKSMISVKERNNKEKEDDINNNEL